MPQTLSVGARVISGAMIAGTAAVVARCVWERRVTWRVRWEQSQTLSILLQCIGLLLIAPWQTALIGDVLHAMTGMWHLEDYIGHVCYLAAAGAVVNAAAVRLTDDAMRGRLIRLIAIPGGIAVVMMLVAQVFGHAEEQHFAADYFRVPLDGWLSVYWLFYCGTLLYMLALASWLLFVLGADRRSRHTARFFMLGCGCGVAATSAWIIAILADSRSVLGDGDLAWMLVCSATLFFAIGSARSWRQKITPFDDMLRVVRT